MNDRRAPQAFGDRAESVAYRSGLYDLPAPAPGWLGDHIDLWGYESGLPDALDQLVSEQPLPARTWLENLVPFVAGLFARGPNLNRGQNNEARLRVFQEMLAPVMAANWTVVHHPDGGVITNDKALAPFATLGGLGYAVPLGQREVLLLTPCGTRQIARRQGGTWYTDIIHRQGRQGDRDLLRRSLAEFALDAIYGPTEESVEVPRELIGSKNEGWPSGVVNPSICDLTCHLYDYFRAVSAISARPGDEQAAADRIDVDALLPRWSSPIVVEVGSPERTRGGITLVAEDEMWLSMALGLFLRNVRVAVGDFRLGAFGVFPFEKVRHLPKSLGGMCREGANGRRGITTVWDPGTGRTFNVRLNVLPEKLPTPEMIRMELGLPQRE